MNLTIEEFTRKYKIYHLKLQGNIKKIIHKKILDGV